MADPLTCPVCLNSHSKQPANIGPGVDGWGCRVNCPICGRFDVTRQTWEDYLDPESTMGRKLPPLARARLSHRLRTTTSLGPAKLPRLESDALQSIFDEGIPGPTPAQQAQNIVRLLGDYVSETGSTLGEFPEHFYAAIGAPNPKMAANLALELYNRGTIVGLTLESVNLPPIIHNANLSLDGWEQYEAESRDEFAGGYGFIALKFNETSLDHLVSTVIKPSIKETLGYDVVDMRDISRAGLIDNIMRAKIRDAAFVLVDLTHDNAGAYWEAGYAEGLGKPVIYLCERAKFDQAKTHFDTNHCTTVCWGIESPDLFRSELVATLRRSLNLFPTT